MTNQNKGHIIIWLDLGDAYFVKLGGRRIGSSASADEGASLYWEKANVSYIRGH